MKGSGVYVALVTPFQKDGSLDLPAFRRHIKWLLESGINGLVPCGTTGESATLSRAERVALIEACLEGANGKDVEVIPGCGGNSTHAVRELIQEAEGLGCTGTLVVTPYYNKPTPSGLLAHYRHLAEHCQRPILLYHVPGRTQVTLPLEIVHQLFEHPNIAGIKEASGQYGYWLGLSEIARATGKSVFAGDDDAFAIIQAFGGKGVVGASANAVPEAYVEMYRFMLGGEWEAAFRLQLRLAPLVRALFTETNPGPIKYALHSVGRMENVLRLPLVPVSAATETLVGKQMQRFREGRNRGL